VYGSYGNATTEKVWGDTTNTADNAITTRSFYANTTSPYYIVSKIKEEKVYSAADNNFTVDEANLKKDTLYYYDGNNTSQTTQPTAGNLTRVQSKKDASNSVSSYSTYDSYGNKATETDANGNATSYTYDSTYHIYPITKTYPSAGGVQLSESCTYQDGTGNILTHTDVNGQVTQYTYDTFKRLIKVYKPGDTQSPNDRPSIVYNYSDWGSTWVDNKPKQRLETWQKVTEDNYPTNYAWQYQFFDGLGRIIQTQSQGESGYTIVDKTTTFNNVGQVDKEYVSQNITTPSPTIYQAPQGKYTSYSYDALGRILKQYNIDGTDQNGNYTGYDYTIPWQINVRNPLGFITNNYYNAFGQMVKVEEPDASNGVYATTKYEYDTLGNLTRVLDANNSSNPSNPTYATTMTYNWLSHKTGMTDPDMGSWSYVYDNNGNLYQQTDAKSQTITMVYDAMNRLTNKNYPAGSGMTNIVYSYDSIANGNYGKGLRTGMTDAATITTSNGEVKPATWIYRLPEGTTASVGEDNSKTTNMYLNGKLILSIVLTPDYFK